MKNIRAALLLLFALLAPAGLWAQSERILHFDIHVSVETDRSIIVTETIEVIAAGQTIQRGITRRLPSASRVGKRNIIEIQKNGRPEPYHTERTDDGELIIYIGEQDVYLDPGTYTYALRYRVANEIRLFPDYDEVYWNAVGTDWDFPVDKATCTVQLPAGATILQTAAYTGVQGDQGRDYTIRQDPATNQIFYSTTRELFPREGFTVAAGFNKGIVAVPTFLERYRAAILLALGALGLSIYYLATIWRYGIDPPKPAVYPLYYPPQGLSPAAIGYIAKEKYDTDLLTASLIQLAVKGRLLIEENVKKNLLREKTVYSLRRSAERTADTVEVLAAEEGSLMRDLFSAGDEVEITGKPDQNLTEARDSHRLALKNRHETFIKEGYNRKFVNISMVATVLLGLIAIGLTFQNDQVRDQSTDEGAVTLFALITLAFGVGLIAKFREIAMKLLSVAAMFGLFVIAMVVLYGPSVYEDLPLPGVNVILTSALNFFQSAVDLAWKFLHNYLFSSDYLNAAAIILFFLFSVASMLIYRYLIRKPSVAKQKLQAEIEGFKMYLTMAEKDRLELLHPPERTPEHFEALLPYAYAIGVAHQWTEQFKQELEAAAYQPRWSNDQSFNRHSTFSSSFRDSVTSSSSYSSSSGGSGSSGGGASGGGGGGGGGGGW